MSATTRIGCWRRCGIRWSSERDLIRVHLCPCVANGSEFSEVNLNAELQIPLLIQPRIVLKAATNSVSGVEVVADFVILKPVAGRIQNIKCVRASGAEVSRQLRCVEAVRQRSIGILLRKDHVLKTGQGSRAARIGDRKSSGRVGGR